jgi:hypothetical protein
MANEGADLIHVYQSFETTGNASALPGQFPMLQFKGNSVLVDVKMQDGSSFSTFQSQLTSLGMQVTASSAYYGLVDGYVPIAELPSLATMASTMSATPGYKPQTRYVGDADNESERSVQADVARSTYNVDGTGVTVGVISDSVSQYQGGLADSVKTGDLPSNVKVVMDGPSGSTDEGRAMLENVHDIAPGASLQFATGDSTDLQFGQNIQALAAAGSNIVVDDLGYADEPFFQDGLIQQGVDAVVKQGVAYFSAAGNTSPDEGYLSNFRATTATVGSLGAGTYMNFNPGGGVLTQLPITVTNATGTNPAELLFQFDQPFATQQPSGSTAKVTSEVDFYVLDSAGNTVASGNTNNVATQTPEQVVPLSSNGSYTVVIKVVSGPNPGHVEFLNFNENTDVKVSTQFGAAGNTSYPDTYGHSAQANTIGVAAMPWWASAPYLGQSPLQNEPFSSPGPALVTMNPDGSPLSAPQVIQNPSITAPDGGNTSFFPPGGTIDTSNPPFPGEPATQTNLSQNLPSFFGTSSAAPNAAAVAALMLQRVPNLSPNDIRQAMESSATPMNGTAKGAWNTQSGFGLVNAVAAIDAADVLRVVTTTPANNATLTTSPSVITVTFNKPVDFSTVKASDLLFTGMPAGITVNVGTPIAVDNATDPTVISFPFSFTTSATTPIANGKYSFTVKGPVKSEDGKPLAPYTSTFTLNDTTSPRIVATAVSGRRISIQFSEAMRPSSINKSTVFLTYDGPNGPVNLNNALGAKLTYNPLTNTATLDYTGLTQTQMPNGTYTLTVLGGGIVNGQQEPSVLSNVGNMLNGAFSGTFPTGVPPTTKNPTPHGDFHQQIGPVILQAPLVTSFQLAPGSDSGIKGDQNTNVSNPTFIGQVSNAFPGTYAGVTVLVEFNALHGGTLDLTTGANGRGSNPGGHIDIQTTTDANGTFRVTAPFLPEGFQEVAIVVVGPSDSPPLPGLSSTYQSSFRVDLTAPQIVSARLVPGGANLPLGTTGIANLSSLTNLSLNVVDQSNPLTGPFATPAPVIFPALDPSTVVNVSNYSLINTTTGVDESSFIATATFVPTSANFVAAPNRTAASTPYFGRIDLTFLPGLPQGAYQLIARTTETKNGKSYPGITDAAGNALDDTTITSVKDFVLNFNFQAQPVFVTGMNLVSSYQGDDANGNLLGAIGGPRSYFEEVSPSTGTTSNATLNAPPGSFVFDFSNPLALNAPNGIPIDYQDAFQLIRSANSSGSPADGDFGTLGVAGLTSTGTGFTRMPVTVTLYDPPTDGTAGLGTPSTSASFDPLLATRVVVTYAGSGALPPDDYRVYLPNVSGSNTQLYDVYGNQLDGEFLGDQTGTGSWEDLLPNGQYRQGLSGNGVSGGAFMTAFTVVPFAHVIYARPGYVENPLEPATEAVGSITNPYAVLAPQDAQGSGPANPNHDPNGGMNDTSNFFNFNPSYDRAGIGTFERSAFYAAQQLSFSGPVVVIAEAGVPTLNPLTNVVSTPTFVLQAPAGSNSVINNGSASVPFNTTVVFQPGATLKMENANLFVQNQGAALQMNGGPSPSQNITVTSYANDAIAGDTNHDNKNTTPRPGDFGGIVFQNFDQQAYPNVTFPVDGQLQGLNGNPSLSGEDDAMSVLNYTNVSYGGGAVPQTIGLNYSGVTLKNARPALTNMNISLSGASPGSGNSGSAVGAIGADLDSFRADDLSEGPLIRRVSVTQNGLNGIWLTPEFTGVVESTNAVPLPNNPITLGGSQNYTFNEPLPFILTSRLDVGNQLHQGTGGVTVPVENRLNILPGMMLKFQHGAGIQVLTDGASMIVGDQTYISRWDAQAVVGPDGLPSSTYNPTQPDFQYDASTDAKVIFTSLYDNNATTSFLDPATGLSTTIVPAIDSANSKGLYQPVPGKPVPPQAAWGSITYFSGSYGIFNSAIVEYGGSAINVAGGTTTRNALSFLGAFDLGTRVMVTNNDFHDNADTPIGITPSGLLAADPLNPLSSGYFFMRGNTMENNTYNGLGVLAPFPGVNVNIPNLFVNSVWDLTDVTYFLRGTIVAANGALPGGQSGDSFASFTTIESPSVTLTLQSNLAGTLLANGQSIAKPGEALIVKLLNQPGAPGVLTPAASEQANTQESFWEGAGFVFGVDNGVDSNDPLIDPGNNSQLRILGIGGNETTGQSRVPVIITSAYNNNVGTTVNGVTMNQVVTGSTQAPAAGDGGMIAIGGNTLTNFNLLDPRQGSVIDNADISDISSIQVQGGGIVDTWDLNGDNSFSILDDPGDQKIGSSLGPRMQYNAAKQLVISNSNLSTFRDAGVVGNPGYNFIAIAENYPHTPGIYRSGFDPEPYHLFMYNDSIANMPIGVELDSEKGSNTVAPSPEMAVFLNDTFYHNPIGIQSTAPSFDGTNSLSHISFLTMDSIFSNSTTAAILITGQDYSTQGQYNLFWQNAVDVNAGGSSSGFPNNQPINGDPMFVSPTTGNFQLQPGSAAIDESISEFGPSLFGDMLYPIATQVLNQTTAVRNQFGNSESADGGLGFSNSSLDVITLPGYPIRDYTDEWVAVLPSDPTSVLGTGANAATWAYAPMSGERDLRGYLRQKDPNSPNVGFGSRPYFDIGAYEFRQLFPPHVTAVTATVTSPNSPGGIATSSIYAVNGVSGVNQTPQYLQFTFDHNLDPNTVNGSTVLLEGSGGDGIFGNNNSPSDKFYNLAGKVSFDPSTDVLTVNLAAAGLTLTNDEYRIVLLGRGSNVLADPEGNALDGQNTLNDDPNNPQLALPSGTGFPGSNFFLTFTINTETSSIVKGTFHLSANSDSNNSTDNITNDNLPTFVGTITDADPAIDPLGGQTVIIDVSTKGIVNGKVVWDLIAVGSGKTNNQGQFSVPVNVGLGNSGYNVGPDGLLNSPLNLALFGKGKTSSTDDTGQTLIRARIIDTSGNVSDQPTDPLTAFQANNAVTSAVIDTIAPDISSISPAPNSVNAVTALTGAVTVSFTVDKNLDLTSLQTPGAIVVTRSGPDGVLGTSDDVTVQVNTSSITITPLKNGPLGPERVTFTISSGLVNDEYRVALKGTGTTPITDIAGNALDGAGTGKAGSGDFTDDFVIFNARAVSHLYVGAASYITNAAATLGSREHPYPTIQAAINAAKPGDIVGILPGVYTGNVQLKSFVKVLSANPASTDGNLINGSGLDTVIRAPLTAPAGQTLPNYTVEAINVKSFPGLDAELSGVTVTAPLVGDQAAGTVDTNRVGMLVVNSNVLIDRNYFIDANVGIMVEETGTLPDVPRIRQNVIAGNTFGINVDGSAKNLAVNQFDVVQVLNNDIVFNTIGLNVVDNPTPPLLVSAINNIFWQNHDLTAARTGAGISAAQPGAIIARHNLFQSNGVSDTNPIDAGYNVGNGFDASALTAVPDKLLGNYTGKPAFVMPADPRPGVDGPAIFLLDADYDITISSAAIDGASQAAPALDFLYHGRVTIPGHGHFLGTGPGFPTGPGDVGAFEYIGTNTAASTTLHDTFRVINDSLSSTGRVISGGSTSLTQSFPRTVTIQFSGPVVRSSVTASDLTFSGSGVSPADRLHATGVTWLNDSTVRFTVAGSTVPGPVTVSLAAGSVTNVRGGLGLAAFSDTVVIGGSGGPQGPTLPTQPGGPTNPGSSGGSTNPTGPTIPPMPTLPTLPGSATSTTTQTGGSSQTTGSTLVNQSINKSKTGITTF